mmetsp:Transcript_12475/g.38052  ORF Transcript_12475/g.38052 Transcript_12475/m.38052 type:complete len:161 (+) Transcript_12475:308-790(+)
MNYSTSGFADFLKRRGQTTTKSSSDTLSVEDDSFFSLPSTRGRLFSDSQMVHDDREDRENSVLSVTSVKMLSANDRDEVLSLRCSSLSEDKSFQCPKCDRTFKRQGNYTRHLKSHQDKFSTIEENQKLNVHEDVWNAYLVKKRRKSVDEEFRVLKKLTTD